MKNLRTAVILHQSTRLTENLIRQWTERNCKIIYTGNVHPDEKVRQSTIKRFDFHALVEHFEEKNSSIDYLLINFDHRTTYRAAIEEFPVEIWREILDKTLCQTFAFIKILWPKMQRQHFGRIIFQLNENPTEIGEFRSASRTICEGLRGLSHVLALEGQAFGITSNLIYPNSSTKNFFDLIWFLCDEKSTKISGKVLPFSLEN